MTAKGRSAIKTIRRVFANLSSQDLSPTDVGNEIDSCVSKYAENSVNLKRYPESRVGEKRFSDDYEKIAKAVLEGAGYTYKG